MTVSPSASLLQHEAFAELSDAGRPKLEQATAPLSLKHILPIPHKVTF